ncbi:hypothetical protein ABMA28_010038 [Loxostege sticticalis]|uniref:Uncharacterized protein n=1 Tax=Loxostege sticticalis TaxID=481309 RepID=A0ABD0S9H2_LOXSC
MGIYDKYYKFICRVCLLHRSNEEMVCLKDKNSENGLSCYGKAVEQFANVSIKINDELPHSMCQNCLTMLNQAIQFKSQCEKNDKYLSKLFLQHIESDSNLKEIVVDFSLFRHINPQEFLHITSSTNIEIELECKSEEVKKSIDNEQLSYENKVSMTPVQDESDIDTAENTLVQLEKEDLSDPTLSESKCSEGEVKPKIYQIKILSEKKIQDSNHHTNNNNKTDKYVCETCEKVLGCQTTYKMHMHHHNGFNHICEHCGRGFPVLSRLEKHRFTFHSAGRYFQCPHCPHKAPTNYCLQEHVRIHTGERPHVCHECGLTFRRLYLYNRHKFYHKEKRFKCPHCPKKFHTSAEVREHSNNNHERVYMYLCPECHITCTRQKNIRRHMKNIHGIPREKQGKIKKISVKGQSTSDTEIPLGIEIE